ncbi:MAG: hypothetical protein GXP29_00485 [Planctomycetes bacterium]|nr:hypothetical protein [Planctomycetota bacterium]
MNSDVKPRVLDVGQCDMDHGSITRLLKSEFDATVDRARDVDQVNHLLQFYEYDLILVNRIFDANGDEGQSLIERLKSGEPAVNAPIMLVSNFDDAQATAQQSGAVAGFGKSAIDSPETVELLSAHLKAT